MRKPRTKAVALIFVGKVDARPQALSGLTAGGCVDATIDAITSIPTQVGEHTMSISIARPNRLDAPAVSSLV
jgi:hypothetical protein